MAGQRENDEVEAEIEAAFQRIKHLRPTHRTVSMWKDLNDCLASIRQVEFLCGLLPEKPRTSRIDVEAVQMQLTDARGALGMLALAIAEDAE